MNLLTEYNRDEPKFNFRTFSYVPRWCCRKLTYSMEHPASNANILDVVKGFHALYCTQNFITVFRSARHFRIFFARRIQSAKSVSKLTFHIVLFPFKYNSPNYVCTTCDSNDCYMPCLSRLNSLNLPSSIWWRAQMINFLVIIIIIIIIIIGGAVLSP
jgi:hypothetical protein